MIILQILSLIFWLIVVPFCIGLLPFPMLEKRFRTPGIAFLAGYIVLFAFLEIIGIPVVLLTVYNGFTTFMKWYIPVLLLMAIAGVVLLYRDNKNNGNKGMDLNFHLIQAWKQRSIEERVFFILFGILVGFQMYMAFTRASFDGDDAYYGVQALIAQKADSLYRVNPNTGRSAPLDARHGLALFPIWEAFIGKMSGIHATIIGHSIIPLLLIPLTYLLYFQIGKILFSKKKELLPMFLILMGLWQTFGNISIYTTETFFLTRTWQGKSFAGNFVIPAVFFLFLAIFMREDSSEKTENSIEKTGNNIENTEDRSDFVKSNKYIYKQDFGLWILLGALNLAAGASSSLAVLLSCMLTAGLGALMCIREKKFMILIKSGLACIPGGIYVLIYILLSH